jgi:hypothetical protein
MLEKSKIKIKRAVGYNYMREKKCYFSGVFEHFILELSLFGHIHCMLLRVQYKLITPLISSNFFFYYRCVIDCVKMNNGLERKGFLIFNINLNTR